MILFHFVDVETKTHRKYFDFAKVTKLLRAALGQLRPLLKKGWELSHPEKEGTAPDWKECRGLGRTRGRCQLASGDQGLAVH